jgi:hypothetical protein
MGCEDAMNRECGARECIKGGDVAGQCELALRAASSIHAEVMDMVEFWALRGVIRPKNGPQERPRR